jgi:hypothetical protein
MKMNTLFKTMALMFCLLISFQILSQQVQNVAGSNKKVVKTYQSKEIGNGVYLNEVFNDANAGGVYRGFRIHVNNDAYYYISAWMQGLLGSSQDVLVDGQMASYGKTLLQKQGWQASSVVDNFTMTSPITIHLSSGDHVITFHDKGPGIPDVEYIRLGKTQSDVFISDTAFQNKLSAIKAYAASHPIQPISDDSTGVSGDATMAPLTYNPPPRNDSLNDYVGFLNKPFSYTYREWFYFNTGDHPVFTINNATTSCYMYFFNAYNITPNTSWCGNSIDVVIPNAGSYMLMVRAYLTGNRGTADLYQNGALHASGIIVAGTYYAANLGTKTGVLNYFTCNPPNNPYTTDTYIFLSTFRNSTPIAAYNDDYIGSGNFNWGYWSRMEFNLAGWPNPFNRAYIFGSAYSSYGDGNCDFYLCNEFSGTFGYPYLQYDDAMESAEEDTNYNCFSWSGGRTNLGKVFDPEDPNYPTNRWYDRRSAKQCFDNFYGNVDSAGHSCPRYQGAMTYLPTNDTPGSEIDLYQGPPQGDYSHAAVRKPDDYYEHGYDWESKMGQAERIFHPRHALEQGDLGNPTGYYKHSGAMANSSAINGNKLAASISLSANDMKKIDSLHGIVDEKTKVAFDSLYALWKKTWCSPELRTQSAAKMFFLSEEYSRFAAFCITKGKVIVPLCIRKYLEGDELAAYAICKLNVIPGNGKIMDTVRKSSLDGTISSDGYFILEGAQNGWIRYLKILLDQEL